MKRVTACILALLLCLSAAAQAAQPAVLRVEDKVLAEGENSFTLDVVLEGDGTNCGGSFVLWYDSSCLELTGFETGPAVSGAVAVTNPELGDGVAKMSWISLEPLTGGGAIAKATFRVLLEEPTTVEILNPQLLDREGEDLPVTAAQGTIRPEGAQPTTPPPVQETPAQPSQTPDQPSGEKPPVETDKPEQPDPEEPPEIWSNPFTDVPSGSWFHDAVAYVVEEGLFTGTSENTFSPQLSMNREAVPTEIVRDGSSLMTSAPAAPVKKCSSNSSLSLRPVSEYEWQCIASCCIIARNPFSVPDGAIRNKQVAACRMHYDRAFSDLYPCP